MGPASGGWWTSGFARRWDLVPDGRRSPHEPHGTSPKIRFRTLHPDPAQAWTSSTSMKLSPRQTTAPRHAKRAVESSTPPPPRATAGFGAARPLRQLPQSDLVDPAGTDTYLDPAGSAASTASGSGSGSASGQDPAARADQDPAVRAGQVPAVRSGSGTAVRGKRQRKRQRTQEAAEVSSVVLPTPIISPAGGHLRLCELPSSVFINSNGAPGGQSKLEYQLNGGAWQDYSTSNHHLPPGDSINARNKSLNPVAFSDSATSAEAYYQLVSDFSGGGVGSWGNVQGGSNLVQATTEWRSHFDPHTWEHQARPGRRQLPRCGCRQRTDV